MTKLYIIVLSGILIVFLMMFLTIMNMNDKLQQCHTQQKKVCWPHIECKIVRSGPDRIK
jgi:hypothetical protein